MVRRVGGLWPHITDYENLLAATLRSARGKHGRRSTARFLERRELECLRLQAELRAGDYRPGDALEFEIWEPKLRRITVLPFRDRVVHHALIRVIEPILERSLIDESFACRRGKGTHRALDHAQRMLRRHDHSLALDIRSFFASIAHEQVMARLEHRIKDRQTLALCRRILVGGDETVAEGRGLPIGSLTSQWFATLQLDPLDHFVKETLRIPGYVRYMDDFVLFDDDRARLASAREALDSFLQKSLDLALKPSATRLAPAHQGLPFLGWHLYRGHRRLRQENLRRSSSLLRRRQRQYARGQMDEEAMRCSIASLCEHLGHGSTRELRRTWFESDRGNAKDERTSEPPLERENGSFG